MIKNICLAIVSILITLVLVEVFLWLQPAFFQHGRKYFLDNDDGHDYYATCYPTPPKDGFNIQLNSKDSCVVLQEKYNLQLSFLMKLMQRAPFCIDYDIERRQKGFFPDRDKTLFIVGDSFAFGEGVLGAGTVAYKLSARLPAYNVRNFAQSAANIAHVTRQVEKIVADNPAPRIIYFLNLNDPLHSEVISREKRLIADFQNFRADHITPDDLSQNIEVWGIGAKLKIIQLVRQTWAVSKEKRLTVNYYHRIYFDNVNAPEIESTFEMLSRMNGVVSRADGRFILVIWPLIHKDLFGGYPFKAIHDEIKERCVRNSIVCIDGLDAFREYRSMKRFRVHPLDYHPNALANRIMADYLVDHKNLAKSLK